MQNKAGVVRLIRQHRRFLISSHINPEGDSLGSALALRGLLLKLGKKVDVVWDGPIPEAYRFLPGISSIRRRPSRAYDAAVIVDCPVLERIGKVRKVLEKGKPLCVIDHHASGDRFGTVHWVDPKAAAVGEMIYALFSTFRVPIDLPEAVNLYVSLMTDTGSFRYSNTTPNVHRIAAHLIRLGIRPVQIGNWLYESHTLSSRRLLTLALKTLRVDRGGKCAWLSVTRNMLAKCRSRPEETEGFVDFARALKSVQVALFFREEKGGEVKVSFRSKGRIDVNRIARRFGGGGHRAASGCRLSGPLKKAEARVLKEVRRALEPS